MSETVEDHVICNLCGTDDPRVVFKRGQAQEARIVRCGNCGLMYADPRVGLVDHADYEQFEADGILMGSDTDPDHPWRWRNEKEKEQVRDFDATRAIIDRLYPQGGKLVEVGSGLGYLMQSFKKDGWDVLGVDPWKELPAFTEQVHGIETIPTTLEDAGLPDASADLVILLHVIEHVPDPVGTLREINRVLKPGGHVVVETPRYDTAMFKLLKHRERSVRCDGHIYFFTFDTLRRTYEKAGFTEVDTRAVGRTLTMQRFLWNVGQVTGRPGFRDGLTDWAGRTGLDRLRFRLNLRDMQRIVARKDAV